MENREYLNELFDIYKELLTEIEQVTFKSYYGEDLSLSEIAENRNISKSSVGKTISIAEEKLKNYEAKLKIHETKQQLREVLDSNNLEKIKDIMKKIIDK